MNTILTSTKPNLLGEEKKNKAWNFGAYKTHRSTSDIHSVPWNWITLVKRWRADCFISFHKRQRWDHSAFQLSSSRVFRLRSSSVLMMVFRFQTCVRTKISNLFITEQKFYQITQNNACISIIFQHFHNFYERVLSAMIAFVLEIVTSQLVNAFSWVYLTQKRWCHFGFTQARRGDSFIC